MPETATLWDLVTDERIAIEAVTAAVDAYLIEPTTGDHPIGLGYVLDLAAAVAAHAAASGTMIDAEANEPSRRIAVRSALLMASPRPTGSTGATRRLRR